MYSVSTRSSAALRAAGTEQAGSSSSVKPTYSSQYSRASASSASSPPATATVT